MPDSRRSKRVLIVGGGLAGLAAAVRCIRHGLTPVVLEKRGYLGGRAFSFVDRETGVEVDNGQHVHMGACTAYREFIAEIGAQGDVYEQPRLDVPVLRDGVVSHLGWSSIPGLGMLPSLLRYRHLAFADKLRVIYGMTRIRLANREREAESLNRQTFREWLERHGQSEMAIANLWNLIVLPALNDDIGDVCADAGIMLFQTALMGSAKEAILGYSRVGLSELAGRHGEAYVTRNGGQVRLNAEVSSLWVEDGRVRGIETAESERLEADVVVSAVPHFAVRDLVTGSLNGLASIEAAASLESAPIVGIHIWYDRPVMDADFTAVLDSPLQFVFNVSAMHRENEDVQPGGQHIVISLSGAWRWSQMDRNELREIFVAEMARSFPAATKAVVTRFLSVKQVNATFRVTPGSASGRLPQRTGAPNFFLAGDWTATDWPSTMESAVRSGNMAADAAAEYLASSGAS